MPLLLLSGPLIGCAVGWWLDRRFGTAPWLLLTLVILGLVASGREAVSLIRRIGRS